MGLCVLSQAWGHRELGPASSLTPRLTARLPVGEDCCPQASGVSFRAPVTLVGCLLDSGHQDDGELALLLPEGKAGARVLRFQPGEVGSGRVTAELGWDLDLKVSQEADALRCHDSRSDGTGRVRKGSGRVVRGPLDLAPADTAGTKGFSAIARERSTVSP